MYVDVEMFNLEMDYKSLLLHVNIRINFIRGFPIEAVGRGRPRRIYIDHIFRRF